MIYHDAGAGRSARTSCPGRPTSRGARAGRPILRTNGTGMSRRPAGLEPVVVDLLARAGVAVVRGGEPASPLTPAAPPGGRIPGVIDPALVDFARGADRGLVRVGAGVCPARLVAQLRLAFPAATI